MSKSCLCTLYSGSSGNATYIGDRSGGILAYGYLPLMLMRSCPMRGPGGCGSPFKSIVCNIYPVTEENMDPTPCHVMCETDGFRTDYVAGETYTYGQDQTWRVRMAEGRENYGF